MTEPSGKKKKATGIKEKTKGRKKEQKKEGNKKLVDTLCGLVNKFLI